MVPPFLGAFKDAVICKGYIMSNDDRIIMNNELIGMWWEAVVA